jgi:hypothetical protein
MKSFRPGDRVSDPFFGDGVVVERIERVSGACWYMVEWDIPPLMEYNLGKNPCLFIPREVMS